MLTSPNSSVQLYFASLELLNDESFSTQILCWLSIEEQKRYKSFVSKQQANQYLLARALLRSQLSKRVQGVLPCEWVFVIDHYGKPRLADEFSYLDLHFNLSHSESLVVLVLGEGLGEDLNLGIDVEFIHRPVFNMAFAKRYFAKTELDDLMKLTERKQNHRIAHLWTLKESYFKASGLGVRVPLTKLAFSFNLQRNLDLSLSLPFDNTLPIAKGCYVALFELCSDYSLALTVDTDKEINITTIAINQWLGLNNQNFGFRCELLRAKTN